MLWRKTKDNRPSTPLLLLMEQMRDHAHDLLDHRPEPALVRARLADAYRRVGVEPPTVKRFDSLGGELDEGAWQRLSLVVEVLRTGGIGQGDKRPRCLSELLAELQDGLERMFAFAREAQLLTLELIAESPTRLEEFCRRLCLSLDVALDGETAKQSAQRLSKIDYAQLLAEVERAKLAAEDRMAFLEQLQQKQDEELAPRGKW